MVVAAPHFFGQMQFPACIIHSKVNDLFKFAQILQEIEIKLVIRVRSLR